MYKLPKTLFYILSLTWGLPLTIIGAIVFGVLIILGKTPKKWDYCYYICVGKSWGGLEFGLFFIVDESESDHTKKHEQGHGIQNCYFGPFMIFIVCIPSAIRYWYREIIKKINPNKILPEYDSIWFEKQATEQGYRLHQMLI